MNNCHILLISLLATSSANAATEDGSKGDNERGRFSKQGLSGEISLLAGYSSTESNFNTYGEEVKTGSLNSAGESDARAIVAPLGQARYTFGDQQVFVGMSRKNIVEGVFALEAGYAFKLGDHSSLSLSILPTIVQGKTWDNPYQLDTVRQETDVSGNAYRIQYENILDTGIDADFAYFNREIDNEKSGSSLTTGQEKLERDGTGYLIDLAYAIPLSRSTFIRPAIGYQQFSADGDAMSYDQYSLSTSVIHHFDRHAFSANISYQKANYDETNPLFNQVREDTSYGINLAYEYSNFMGWKNAGANLIAGYNDSNSNIDFYDEKGYMFGFGISYKF